MKPPPVSVPAIITTCLVWLSHTGTSTLYRLREDKTLVGVVESAYLLALEDENVIELFYSAIYATLKTREGGLGSCNWRPVLLGAEDALNSEEIRERSLAVGLAALLVGEDAARVSLMVCLYGQCLSPELLSSSRSSQRLAIVIVASGRRETVV